MMLVRLGNQGVNKSQFIKFAKVNAHHAVLLPAPTEVGDY